MSAQPKCRRGITLIETMVAIAVSGVLLSLVGVCLHGLHRAEQRTQQWTTRRAAVGRLSLQLRADAHAAVRAVRNESPPSADASLTLTTASGREIEYRCRNQHIDREVREDGKIIHRDAYRLPGACVTWQVDNDGPRPLIVAVIAALPEPGVNGVAPLAEERLEAVVGLHRTREASKER